MVNNTEQKIIIKRETNIGYIIAEFDSKNDLEQKDIEDGKIYQVNNLNLNEVRALREAKLDIQDFNIDHLAEDLREKVADLILHHAHAFSKSNQTFGQTSLVTPRVELGHDFPIQHKPYKTAQAVKDYAQHEIRKLLEAKIIEKSDSDYAFPVLFVKKRVVIKRQLSTGWQWIIDL